MEIIVFLIAVVFLMIFGRGLSNIALFFINLYNESRTDKTEGRNERK